VEEEEEEPRENRREAIVDWFLLFLTEFKI
jgi:hypothetical protein